MHAVTLIFPHQLFRQHPALDKARPVVLVEEWLFFSQYHFHKQKLILHRASMQFYKNWLEKEGYTVEYIAAAEEKHDIRQLIISLRNRNVNEIHIASLTDDWLERRMRRACSNDISLILYSSPGFLNRMEEMAPYFDNRKTYFQTDFYTDQRKRRKILLDKQGKPAGGKWTYDAENRKRFSKSEEVPVIKWPEESRFVKEARAYVQWQFPEASGETPVAGNSFYPVTFDEATQWLQQFLLQRFPKFGVYEDAMVKGETFLFHSVLTPALNTGLLTPQEVLDAALAFAGKNDIPLNSLEGFVRQVMGWREFIRIVYEREGRKQRTRNYWGFTRKIPSSFWMGTTGIHPVDTVIKRVLKTGYCHHIERLMVLGNFMLLCEFDPDEVYRWFMELFIDSYDWVMVPNVYGMTQFADGGLMTTKPYISGSNYLLKLGDWDKGEWQEIWDGLFWRFMHVHRGFFLQNPRLGMLVGTFDKMPAEKKSKHLAIAETFLAGLVH